MEKQTFDIAKACKAQSDYIKERELPEFPPSNGVCWSCNRNIYTKINNERWGTSSGVSVEKASTALVTGCPHCNRSYCD